MSRKRIAILGATGSIGTQALDVVRDHPDKFGVQVLTGNRNTALLIEQARTFNPKYVVVASPEYYPTVRDALAETTIQVLGGAQSLEEVVSDESVDMVLSALVGAAGLQSTVAAIEAGKDIALANKETLVVGGQLVMDLVEKHGVRLLPVDSEHSAIFQCLVGEYRNPVEKIWLTASGGPFRGKDRAFLSRVTASQALKHPNWEMGAKITVDSASLMNKGLEVIEAKWLFSLASGQIDVVVHPQSIIHSMVQFEDGSIKAQMGLPDMKLPIQYAFAYPDRIENSFKRLNFADYPDLTFEQPDKDTFTNLGLAYQALEVGGSMPCVLNAANEVVVAAFLKGEIGFLEMSDVIAETMGRVTLVSNPSLSDYINIDQESRLVATGLVTNQKKNYQT